MRRIKSMPILLVWLFVSGFPKVAAFAPREQILHFSVPCVRRPTTSSSSVKFHRDPCNNNHKKRVGMPRCVSIREDGDKNGKNSDSDETRAGVLVLFTVPLAWGTFEPAVRYVYEIQPDVPPFLFQFVYYLVAVISLAVFTVASRVIPSFQTMPPTESIIDPTNQLPPSSSSNTTTSWLNGGLELGTYLFLGNAMQVVGLKTVPSDRAAFLLQLTTIFVPLVQSIVAKDLSILPFRTWIACFIALTGVAFIGFDGSSTNPSVMSMPGRNDLSFTVGDFLIVLAALFYTFHCLRLEFYAKGTPALQLALAKASTEMAWCGAVVLGSLMAASHADTLIHDSLGDMAVSSGQNVLQYVVSFQQILQDSTVSHDTWIVLGGATTWIGLVTVGYTIAAQSYGQARVPPATANLIYTIQPLFTALIAFVTLGETLGLPGYVGAILIAAAVTIVAKGTD